MFHWERRGLTLRTRYNIVPGRKAEERIQEGQAGLKGTSEGSSQVLHPLVLLETTGSY